MSLTEMHRGVDHIWAIVDDYDNEFYIDMRLLPRDSEFIIASTGICDK